MANCGLRVGLGLEKVGLGPGLDLGLGLMLLVADRGL